MVFTEICLTKKCNKDCYYCDITNKCNNDLHEIDIDYLKWILNILSDCTKNILLEITGGEIGLVKNIDQVLTEAKNRKFKQLQVTSNGLLRTKINENKLLEIVDSYLEHNIADIDGETVCKHNEELDTIIHKKVTNVIVLTETTVSSLIEHYDKYQHFNNQHFLLKPLVERTLKYNEQLIKDTLVLFTKYNNSKYSKYYYDIFKNNLNFSLLERKYCSLYPPFPVIDIEDKKIYHCSYLSYRKKCISHEINKENLVKLIEGKLFTHELQEYCKECKTVIKRGIKDVIYNILNK